MDLRGIRNMSAGFDIEPGGVRFRRAHLIWPPQPRMIEFQLRILLRRESNRLRLCWTEFNGLRKINSFYLRAQGPIDRVVGSIPRLHRDGECGGGVVVSEI